MLAAILAIVLGVILYFSEDIFEGIHKRKHKRFTSFAAGVSVAYLFIDLLPEFTSKAWLHSRALFLSILVGFSMFHLVEKYLYKWHAKREEFRKVHSGFTVFYHFALGAVLSDVSSFGLVAATMFFIPVALHLAMSSVVEHHIHESLSRQLKRSKFVKFSFAIVPLIGVIAAQLFIASAVLKLIFMGLFAGSMFFIVIREAIPRDDKGEPQFFVLGAAGFSALLFILWNFFPIL